MIFIICYLLRGAYQRPTGVTRPEKPENRGKQKRAGRRGATRPRPAMSREANRVAGLGKWGWEDAGVAAGGEKKEKGTAGPAGGLSTPLCAAHASPLSAFLSRACQPKMHFHPERLYFFSLSLSLSLSILLSVSIVLLPPFSTSALPAHTSRQRFPRTVNSWFHPENVFNE